MCERSQRYTMRDKVIAVIGHGGPFKEYILELARKDNIQVVLVANIPRDKVPCVATYLKYDFSDHIKDDKHAKHILQKLDNLGVELDGCCTFDEFCAPLAALLCEMLKLDGPGFKSTRTAKRKSSTQNCIINYKVDDVHFPSTYSYGERCYHIENKHDIKIAEKSLKFPAIMKLEHGAGAVGVKLVQNGEEAREHFEDLQSRLEGKFDKTGPLGELLGYGSSMLLMAYIDGTEHSVDIVLYKRKLVAVFVKDKVVTPYFTEALACMPSRLSSDKIEQITTAAFQCCTQVGFITGVFNLDMKMTSVGPKLIEINARMGGLYHRDWIKKVYGVDLVRCVFMTACGIKPVISQSKARFQMMGVMCFPSYHESIIKNEHTRDLVRNLQADGSLHYKAIVESGQSADPDTEVPMCNIAVAADNLLEAKEKLLKICKQLQITRKDYIVEEFLQCFN